MACTLFLSDSNDISYIGGHLTSSFKVLSPSEMGCGGGGQCRTRIQSIALGITQVWLCILVLLPFKLLDFLKNVSLPVD